MNIDDKSIEIQIAYALSPNEIYFSCSVMPIVEEFDDVSVVFRFRSGVWTCWVLKSLVVGMSAIRVKGVTNFIVIGRDGFCYELENDEFVKRPIESSGISPNGLRSVTRSKCIESSIYLCGMGRLVLSAKSGDKLVWRRQDEGCLIDTKSTEINGFLDIDGLSEKNICAVGFKGDIWSKINDAWRRVDSPTNVKMAMIGKYEDYYVAGGNHGTIVVGCDEEWEVVNQSEIADCLRYGVQFKDYFYMTTENGQLYRLNSKLEVTSIQSSIGESEKLYTVFSCDKFLYVTSPTRIFYTKDLEDWSSLHLPE